MSLRCARVPAAVLAATLLAACAQPVATHISAPVPRPALVGPAATPRAVVVDGELGHGSCGAAASLRGWARLQVRGAENGGGELEYELTVMNPGRRRLAEAAVQLSADGRPVTVALWTGQALAKPRVRVRGIVGLPAGISALQVGEALRDRGNALSVRISDDRGAPATCADLRN